MNPLRRLGRTSLLTRFGVVSLVLTVALGVVLSAVLERVVTERARDHAEWAAAVTVRTGLQPQLTAADFGPGFDPSRMAHVEAALVGIEAPAASALNRLDVVTIKMFDRTGLLFYSNQRNLIGRNSYSVDLQRVLGGALLSKFTSPAQEEEADGRDTRLLEVYVPVQFPGSSAPVGVVEVYLPYEPIAAAVREDVRTLNLALAAGLGCFYLALLRVVGRASGRLRRQSEALRDSAERNRYHATHDPLTGLPNRALFRDRADQAFAASSRTGAEIAVVLVDLDRFKDINDILGHSYGDELLCQVGPRLRSALRDGDTVARLGGDEFAVLLPTIGGPEEARAVAERLREALDHSFDVHGVTLDLEASVGVAVAPWHGADPEQLLRSADLAMYSAKERKAGAVVFEPDEHVAAPGRLSILGNLRRALDVDDELFIHYQPKIALADGHVEGLEALLRWNHPERGLVPPAEFIPVAEGTGIIVRLTERVLRLALEQLRAWMELGCAVPVAVNVSTRCLLDGGFSSLVGRLLIEYGIPGSLLRLEVTESAVMDDPRRCTETLERLASLGVRLSIDDFGTGYTSMAHLRGLPIDELKIDRSFVLGMTTAVRDEVLVRTAIDLGHNLGLTVVAEGVETAEHVQTLESLGCDVAQGFHFAPPMPAEQATAVLIARDPAGAVAAPRSRS